MKAYLVMDKDAEEGVVFTEKSDAKYAATGKPSGFGVSTLADEFRNIYADDDEDKQFEMVEIEI